MADGEVVGTFDIRTPALRKLRELNAVGRQTDNTMQRLGRTLDGVGGKTASRNIGSYRKALKGLSVDARDSMGTVRREWQAADRQVKRSVARQSLEIRGLRKEMRSLHRQRVAPKIEIGGLAEALIQIRLLMREMDKLDRKTARANINAAVSGGAAAASSSASGGIGGAAGAVRSVSLGPLNMAPGALKAGYALALPVVNSLVGATTALAGSLGAAATAAGAFGVAMAGAGAVGLGTIAAVAVPAIARIKEVFKAQTQLSDAQKDSLGASNFARAGAERMRAANERLSGSQRSAKQAQEALTQARKDGRRELVNMALAADRSRLSERRANLEVKRTREELRRVQSDPRATEMDITDAKLSVQEALLGKREARITKGRDVADSKRAKRGGLERLPGVKSARQATQDSQRELVNARRGLREAARELSEGASSIAQSKQDLDEAFSRAPRGTRALIAETRKLQAMWGAGPAGKRAANSDIRGAQEGVVSAARGSVATLGRMTPTLGAAGAQGMQAVNREGAQFGRFASSPRTLGFIKESAAMFDENMSPLRRTVENIADAFMNVTRASRSFLLQGMRGLDRWTAGWATGTSNLSKTREVIGRMVDDLRDWKNLGGATVGVMMALFRVGRSSGSSLVRDLTTWMRVQEKILGSPEGKAKLKKWFEESVTSVKKMSAGLYQIVAALGKIGAQLGPILDLVSTIVSVSGNAGLFTPGALALGLGAASGMRGKGGGGLLARLGGGGATATAAAAAAAAATGGRGAAARAAGGRGYPGGRVPGTGVRIPPVLTGGATKAPGAMRRGGSKLAAGARGAGSRFLPVGALFAGLAAYQTQGDFTERSAAAANSATLGLVPKLDTRTESRSAGGDIASKRIGDFGNDGSIGGLRKRQARLEALRKGAGQRSRMTGDHGFLGMFDEGRGNAKGPTKQQADRAKGEERAYQRLLGETRVALRATGAEQKAMLDARSAQRGSTEAQELQQGFENRRDRGETMQSALGKTVSLTLGSMGKMGKEGKKELAAMNLAWAEQMAKGRPELLGQVRKLREGIAREFGGTKDRVAVVNGQILAGTKSQYGAIAEAMASATRQGVNKTSAEFRRLKSLALDSLEDMGYSRSESRGILKDSGGGSKSRAAAARDVAEGPTGAGQRPSVSDRNKAMGRTGNSARGGRIAGKGLQDTVPVAPGNMAAPGELIVNRHTEQRVNQKLGRLGTTLGSEVSGEQRPHSAGMSGDWARGGRVRASTNVKGSKPGFSVLMDHFKEMFGSDIYVMSGLRPGSTTTSGNTSNHASGDAVDISNPAIASAGMGDTRGVGTNVDRLSKYIGANIKKPPRRDFLWQTSTGGNHYNHIHLGMDPSAMGSIGSARQYVGGLAGVGDASTYGALGANGAAGTTASVAALQARRSGLGGVPGALADAAAANYAGALTAQMRSAVGGGTGGGTTPTAPAGGGGTSGENQALGKRMMLAAGLGADQWPSLQTLWTKESGWKNVMNKAGSGATGIPQALPGSKMASAGADWRTNPATQIKWGLGYIKGRYGTPSAALAFHRANNWYRQGGRVPAWGGWNRKGGTGQFRGATMLGVGEGQPSGGSEQVTIDRVKPGGRGTRGRGEVTVNVYLGGVTVNNGDDVERLASRVADVAARRILVALEGLS